MKVQIYEWLYSHDGSYIRIKKDIKEAEFVAKGVSLATGQNSAPSTAYLTSDALRQLLCYKYASGYSLTWYYSSGIVKLFKGDYNEEHKYKINTDGLYVDDVFMSDWAFTSTQPSFIGSTTTLFDAQDIRQGNVCGLRYFKTDTLYLRPCKLLAPYGSHQIGECAMIDVLSNTLYFNQGSGSFSVEGEAGEVIDTTPVVNNIISPQSKVAVRLRELLVNDESSYINTNIPLKDLQSLKMPVVIPTKALNEAHIFGTLPQGWAGLNNFRCYKSITRDILILMYENDNGNSYEGIHSVIVPITYNKEIEIKYLDHNNGTALAKIGDTEKVISIPTNPTSTAPIVLFCCGQTNWRFVGLKIGKVEINDTIFHPCELALPYGNHLIGEACMINLLNGDLYFNQGTGQFSCEGAVLGYWQDKPMNDHYCDVEGTLHKSVQIFADNGERLRLIWEKNLPFTTHRWLDGDDVANIKFDGIDLNKSDIDIVFSDKVLHHTSSVFSATSSDCAVNIIKSSTSDNLIGLFRNRDTGGTEHIFVTTSLPSVNEVTIKKPGVMVLNGEEYKTKTTITDFVLKSPKTFGFISSFDYDNIHLVPATLKRTLLISEDANGIQRTKGEAVMVDKDRYFQGLPWCFGNSASSGSFSVSDYLIEGEDFERIEGIMPSEKGKEQRIFIYDDSDNVEFAIRGGYMKRFIVFTEYDNVFGTIGNGELAYGNYVIHFNSDTDDRLIRVPRLDGTIKITNHYNVNGVEMPKPISLIRNIFGAQASDVDCAFLWYKSDKLNLIPVRLKKPIEPYCTHNGKGGSEGEYCFFDTISGRAFTNDGSGKFRRYFEEGVDYERVAGVSMINASLPLNIALSDVPMQLEYYYSAQDDGGYFNTRKGVSKSIPYQLYNSASHEFTLRDREQEHSYLPPTADILSASLTTDSVIVNGQTYNLMAGVFEGININANGSVNVRVIKQNGVIDLIPIRLLKKAYASDTHNGREYPSGTICFINTIDGVIYGNDGEGEFSEYIP